ncbi:exopolysaccharide biosynthesis protein [Roseomonas sp. BN140053]|uniref:exopolysaccharide biosynthesis protein n=1 Tax=Roseomonas sp. BN140053 TaxID=3391898 RepID=UPI0039ED8077
MDGSRPSVLSAPLPAAVTPEHQAGAPISRLVAEVAATCPGERITLGEMAAAFDDRAFGLLLLMLCLPALLPAASVVFGLPILLLGLQMGLGRRTPTLPDFMARQSMKRTDLLRLASGSSRWLGRIERYVRPRPGWFASRAGDRIVGWLAVYVALLLILPGPGTNGPPAFGCIVMALGVVEHDNKVIGWGIALTALGCAIGTAMLLCMVWLGWQGLNYVL